MYNILLSFWKNSGPHFFSIADVELNRFAVAYPTPYLSFTANLF